MKAFSILSVETIHPKFLLESVAFVHFTKTQVKTNAYLVKFPSSVYKSSKFSNPGDVNVKVVMVTSLFTHI